MKRVFEGLGTYIEKWHVLVVIVSLVAMVLAMGGASRIEMKNSLDTMISTESQEYKDYIDFSKYFGSDIIVVMVKTIDETSGLHTLLSDANMEALEKVRQELADPTKEYPVVAIMGPDIYLNQSITQQIESGELPEGTVLSDLSVEDRLNLIRDPQNEQILPQFKQVLPDEQHALISIILQGNLDPEIKTEMVETIENAVDAARFSPDVEPIVSGMPALMTQIDSMFMKTTMQMLLLSIALLFIILALIFKVRGAFPWRWLPLLVVIIGVIYTFGLMGITSIPMTMVSMAVFPIMVGLGIDYGIQFHNRYDEEAMRGLNVAQAIRDAIAHIGPSVIIALVAGCLGFVALFFSPVPMIQDFGLLLIIGVVMSYIVATFPLMAILYWHDRRKYNNHKSGSSKNNSRPAPVKSGMGFVEKGLLRLSPWVIKHPAIIIPIAIILTVGGMFLDSRIPVVTDQSTFISEKLTAVKNLHELEGLISRHTSFNILIKTDAPGQSSPLLQPDTMVWMKQLETTLIDRSQSVLTDDGEPVLSSATSIADLVWQANDDQKPRDARQVTEILEGMNPADSSNFISPDYAAGNMVLNLRYTSHEKESDLKDVLGQALIDSPPPQGINLALTGGPVISIKVVRAITGGRTLMTAIGIAFIFGALLLLFRFKLIRAILATLPIVLIIGWSDLAMWILGIEFTPLTATFGALIMGIGVEYTILLMTRYYEERDKNEAPYEAMTTSIAKIGRAISVSAFTTVGGFAALLIAKDFPILTDFGIVTMIDVFLAYAASMLVLPPLIVWIDGWWSGRKSARFL